MIKVAIGIMAYNEEKNIGHLLNCLLAQKLQKVKITDICVVSSGSTDKTNLIVKQYIKKDPRIRLLIQKKREGKASAINHWLDNVTEEVLIMESADTLPDTDTVEKLVIPFLDPKVGASGSHPIPINDKNTFIGFAVNFMWALHHKISLKNPKMGEMIAFRKIFKRIPFTSAVDEANIEPLIRGQGYEMIYVSDAKIKNKGPENIEDFLRQRRRIAAGHLAIYEEQGYTVSTDSPFRIVKIIFSSPEFFKPKYIFWIPAIIFLEAYGRHLGARDYKLKNRNHAVWEIATTTKELKR